MTPPCLSLEPQPPPDGRQVPLQSAPHIAVIESSEGGKGQGFSTLAHTLEIILEFTLCLCTSFMGTFFWNLTNLYSHSGSFTDIEDVFLR